MKIEERIAKRFGELESQFVAIEPELVDEEVVYDVAQWKQWATSVSHLLRVVFGADDAPRKEFRY